MKVLVLVQIAKFVLLCFFLAAGVIEVVWHLTMLPTASLINLVTSAGRIFENTISSHLCGWSLKNRDAITPSPLMIKGRINAN